MINFKLLNSVLDERASQGIERRRTMPVEGFTSRAEHFWGFVPTLRGISGGFGSLWVPRPAYRLRGLGA